MIYIFISAFCVESAELKYATLLLFTVVLSSDTSILCFRRKAFLKSVVECFPHLNPHQYYQWHGWRSLFHFQCQFLVVLCLLTLWDRRDANVSPGQRLFGENISDDSTTVNKETIAYLYPAGNTQNAEIKYKSSLTFDKLLLLALQYVP